MEANTRVRDKPFRQKLSGLPGDVFPQQIFMPEQQHNLPVWLPARRLGSNCDMMRAMRAWRVVVGVCSSISIWKEHFGGQVTPQAVLLDQHGQAAPILQ